MWALRRAPNHLKNPRFIIGYSQFAWPKLEVSSNHVEDKAVMFSESCEAICSMCPSMLRAYHTKHVSSNLFTGRRALSSQAGARSSGDEDDLEDGFSELETPASSGAIQEDSAENEMEDELFSEPGLSSDEDDTEESTPKELDSVDSETGSTGKRARSKRVSSELFKAIANAPGLSVASALDTWVKEGKEVSRQEISMAMLELRRRRMFGRALQLSEWLEANNELEFVERDYAARLDLIAKVRGLQKAENYIEKVPASFRGEVIYRTLLANCVVANNAKKAEEVFNKMKDLEFPVSAFSCNQLLLLYKRLDKKKIADVLLLMEKQNIKPSLFTYRILIDTKGMSNDMHGMDQILETMKAEGVQPDAYTLSILAKHYATAGLKEKAEAVLKEIEGENLRTNRGACRALLPLNAMLGKADEVGRVWKVCESNPRIEECMAAIEAWGKLKRIEEAEAVFDIMSKKWQKLSSKHYSALLKVYANNKMLTKGKDLLKRMADSGCRIGPLTWDAIVKLYVEVGEVEKADSVLNKASQHNQLKPMFNSFMIVMEQYVKRGDIHNSEKIFYRMRQAGYIARIKQFQALVQAYINAKAPAYGMRERIKADNIFPNKALAAQLTQIDPFKKTAVSDLLD